MLNTKPKSCVLWGFNDFTKEYINVLLKDAEVPVEFIVDDNNTTSDYNGVNIISPEQYKMKLRKGYSETPIVITGSAGPKKDGNVFSRTLTDIVSYLGGSDSTILHPSFISDYTHLNFDNKAMVIGCNRSGSTLLFTVIKNLLEKKKNSIGGHKERLSERLAKDHFDILIEHLDGVFREGGMSFSATGATTFKNIEYWGGKRNAFFFMSPLASHRFLFDQVHRSYSVPNKEIIDLMNSIGYRTFSPMRNPLDIIVSNAFELENAFFHMYPDKIQDQIESDIRGQYGLFHLRSLEWFENMAVCVKSYMEAQLEFREEINLIKYEDLISDPFDVIKGISKRLEVETDDKNIISLWERVGFKPLTGYKAHMFRPGKDKWKQFFTKEHMSILKKLRYQELTGSFGYKIDFEHYSSNSPYEKLSAGNFLKKLIAIRDVIVSMQFNMPTSFVDEEISYVQSSIFGKDCKFATNNADFLNIFKNISSSEISEKILNSLLPEQAYSLHS